VARGKFIVVEGIDGAGKSTHLPLICAEIEARFKVKTLLTREPGGSILGESIRELLLHQPMDGETEVLLAFAARKDHLATVIEPALARGEWVVCDRFTDSTRAYQGGGRGVSMTWIDAMADIVHQGLEPDRVFLFDASAELAYSRRTVRAQDTDRFEQMDQAFFRRVRDVYLKRAQVNSQVYQVIDSSRPLDEIQYLLKKSILSI
jgi:dTMP kinase